MYIYLLMQLVSIHVISVASVQWSPRSFPMRRRRRSSSSALGRFDASRVSSMETTWLNSSPKSLSGR